MILNRRRAAAPVFAALASLALLGVASGCAATSASTPESTTTGQLRVVAASGPLAEIAKRIAGPIADVSTLTGTGIEPHDLELTPDQIDAVQGADVVLYLGHGFQPSVEQAVKQRSGLSLDLLDAVELRSEGDVVDPHFWLDPQRMVLATQATLESLITARPDEGARFSAASDTYVAELVALDTDFSNGLNDCSRRTIVTSHSAFGYLAQRYGLQLISVSGISPEVEPNAARLDEVARLVQAAGVTTIFNEELLPSDVAKALARETSTKLATLSPVEGFTKADLAANATYDSKMRANLTVLRNALDCS